MHVCYVTEDKPNFIYHIEIFFCKLFYVTVLDLSGGWGYPLQCHSTFLSEEVSFVHICQEQDNKLFTQILSNEHHVLHQLLPPIRNIPYSLRPRVHDYELPVVNNTMRKNFIIRMLYVNTF